jgi:hypothetical protein
MSDCGEDIKQAESAISAARPSAVPGDLGVRAPGPSLLPEDFYMEGPYLVFTAAYHLRRGFCCNTGCRHCPYK